jgi:hypothetical protein
MGKLRFVVLLGLVAVLSSSCRSFSTLSESDSLESLSPAIQQKLKSCGSQMTIKQYNELLELSDISNFTDYRDAARRSKEVAEIFSKAKDRRGIFASMYVEITQESVASSSRGAYKDSEMAGALVLGFARRYLGPLHDYLLNKPVIAEWQAYYQLAEDCKASDLRILGSGVNTHLTFDLPNTVDEIQAPGSFEADFLKFGEILIEKKKQSTDLLQAQQNVYAADFFDGFFLGKGVDKIFGAGSASYVGFRAIRAEAWANGQTLQKPLVRKVAQGAIHAAWVARQQILRLVPQSQPPEN